MKRKFIKSGKVYKVWIEVEEYDIKTESGETVPIDIGITETFATYDEAVAYAKQIQKVFELQAPNGVNHK